VNLPFVGLVLADVNRVIAGSRMRRNYWLVVANVVVLALVAGCRDAIVAPEAAAPVAAAPASMQLAPAGRPQLSLSGGASQNGSTDFIVGPRGGVFFAGNHAVVFPANSICDPAKSSYGPGTWDAPCKPLTSSIKIHAEVRSENGRSWVDFSPSLRFVPTADASRRVWMFMYTPEAIGAKGALTSFNIYYFATVGGALVDEAATDPSLRTYVDVRTGISARMIKHFSGYLVSQRSCDGALTCETP
jgi:hypothetical protein